MSFCSKCGTKLSKNDTFCSKCGNKTKSDEKKINNENQEKEENEKEIKKDNQKSSNTVIGCLVAGIVVLVLFFVSAFFILAFVGAKGQPGTIIKPTEVKTPKNLTASESDKAINLSWAKSDTKDIAKYNIYKSTKNAKDFIKITSTETNVLNYKDENVKKGITYYYLVTAESSQNESGNSNQVAFALTPPPLIPDGVTSWQDVLTKYEADNKYAEVLTKVTGLNKIDIEKYVSLESKGKKLKTTLSKGTIITNTTEKYKIIPNFVLNQDKEFLTDEKGIPHIMIWCGNPIKLIKKVNWVAKTVESIQKITYNIIYIMPVQITNIFIYAGQPLNTFVINVMPNTFGPTVMNPDATDTTDNWPIGETLIDTIDDLGTSIDDDLEAGQQWAAHGKILLEANPHDPAAYEDVTMIIQIFPAEEGVSLDYSVSGTDGYTASGTLTTNHEGKAEFNIPGGASGVVDTISVKVPSREDEGSTSYTF